MNKRTDTIRSLFTARQTEMLSADNTQAALPRVSAGSVRSLKESFSGVERENEELRETILSGSIVLEIDPALVDSSPITDRFADQDEASFQGLKASIQQRGQELPILVREHPESTGRYQSAYGHRRLRAARELGLKVKAVVRNLSDEDLVVAQGIENSAREDLSFIERAVFAMRLEDAGHERAVVQEALSIDRAEASKLISVSRSIPADVIEAIGRAPRVGRGRWQAFTEPTKQPVALKRIRKAVQSAGFRDKESDSRFLLLWSAAQKAEEPQAGSNSRAIMNSAGCEIARVAQTEKLLKLSVNRGANAGFAAFLVERLPGLFDEYERTDQ